MRLTSQITLTFALLTTSLSAQIFSPVLTPQGNPPGWNYTPMHTVGVFEGLVFGFTRPVQNTATIKVTAIVDGVETHKEQTIAIEEVGEKGETGPTGRRGWFKMTVGNLDKFTVTRIEITEGNFSGDEKNPKPAQYYFLSR